MSQRALLVSLFLFSCTAFSVYPLAYHCGHAYCLTFKYPKGFRSAHGFYLSNPKRFVLDVVAPHPLVTPRLIAKNAWKTMRASTSANKNRWVFYLYPRDTVHVSQQKKQRVSLRFTHISTSINHRKKSGEQSTYVFS